MINKSRVDYVQAAYRSSVMFFSCPPSIVTSALFVLKQHSLGRVTIASFPPVGWCAWGQYTGWFGTGNP